MDTDLLMVMAGLVLALTALDAWRLSGLSNCAIEAAKAKWSNPRARIRLVRNKRGKLHVQWVEHGFVWEYYAKGASKFGFFKRLAYHGRVVIVGKERG